MMIEDGTGTGRKAKVDEANHLVVQSTNISLLEEINEVTGSLWSCSLDAVAPSGATKFFYILNNSTRSLGVASIMLHSTAAGIFRFLRVTGTAAGGSILTPVALNLGSTLPASVLVQTGASITGLTDAALLLPLYVQANSMMIVNLDYRWYLSPNTSIAIQAPAAATVNGSIVIYSE